MPWIWVDELPAEILAAAKRGHIVDDAPAPPDAAPGEELARLQQIVARHWGTTVAGLTGPARLKTLTLPRHVAMYLARHDLRAGLVEIGDAFGGRDHSTVMHAVEKVDRQLRADPDLKAAVDAVRDALRTNVQNNSAVSDNGARALPCADTLC